MPSPCRSLIILLFYAKQIAAFKPGSGYENSQQGFDVQYDEEDALRDWMAANNRESADVVKTCPVSCRATVNSTDGSGWFLFNDEARLSLCNETMLLDMVVGITDSRRNLSATAIRACTADYDSRNTLAHGPAEDKAALCPTPNHVVKTSLVSISRPTLGTHDEFDLRDLLSAGRQTINHLSSKEPSCVNNAISFAYSRTAAVGVFSGAEVHQHGLTVKVLKELLQYAEDNSVSQTTVVQLCPQHGLGADYTMGIVATGAGNLRPIQETIKTWANGGCVDKGQGSGWTTVHLRVPTGRGVNMTTVDTLWTRARITARAECKTTTVQSGDGCWTLADRCKISQDDLKKFNPRANFCNTLAVDEKICCSPGSPPESLPPGNSDGTCKTRGVAGGDSCGSLASKCGISPVDFAKVNTKADLCSKLVVGQQVCCTRGKMPDLRPKPNSDGSCATYTTKQEDSCSSIAASLQLDKTDIESFNKKTWGLNGCKLLWVGFKLCVSSGTPPMPAPISVSLETVQTKPRASH